MFGIGGTELVVIAIVLLIAVGPNRLPNLLKAGVKGYREFRKATRELRASTGIDEILRDEELKDLRRPLHIPPKPASKVAGVSVTSAPTKHPLGYAERIRESPPEGVDVAEARDAFHRPSAEEAERIRAEKQAVVEAKLAAAGEEVSAEEQAVIDAKLAAAGEEVSAEEQAVIDAKLAAAGREVSAEEQAVIDAKLARLNAAPERTEELQPVGGAGAPSPEKVGDSRG